MNSPILQFIFILGLPIGLSWGLRDLIRQPHSCPQMPELDAYEIAYLCGGARRAVELALTQLVIQGYLEPDPTACRLAIVATLPPTAGLWEQRVYQQVSNTPELRRLIHALQPHTTFLAKRMAQEKLFIYGQRARLKNLAIFIFIGSTACFLLTAALGKTYLNNLPIFFPLLFLGVALISYGGASVSKLTHWGKTIQTRFFTHYKAYELNERVAIHGYEAIPDGPLSQLKQLFASLAEEERNSM